MIRRLVIGSKNQKKIREMRTLIVPEWNRPKWAEGLEVVGMEGYPDAPDPEESGATFGENARIKASEFAKAFGEWVLADDSGLTVDALNGAPGVYSARYSGEHGNDDANNQKILEELKGVTDERRGAAFVCHLAVADPDGQIRAEAFGQCRGRIIHSLEGAHGFGYDPLFLIPEYHLTFGQLPPVVKNQLSHRSRAFEHIRLKLGKLIVMS